MFIVSVGLGLFAVACTASPAEESSSAESNQTAVLSCKSKHKAAAAAAHQTPSQAHWRQLLLGVMQPVAGVPSTTIRSRIV